MGCDITLFCEGYLNGKWINIDRWHRQDRVAEYMVTDNEGFDYTDLIGGRRDYGLFYLLAGVRGNDEQETYPPIAKPRGLPGDMDHLIKKYYENSYGIHFFQEETINFHGASYLSLRELKESGYGGVMPLRGWVDETDFAKHEEWMADGHKYQLRFIDVKCGKPKQRDLVLKEWNGYLNLNLTGMIEQMEQLKQERHIGSDDEIRIVFWFDN